MRRRWITAVFLTGLACATTPAPRVSESATEKKSVEVASAKSPGCDELCQAQRKEELERLSRLGVPLEHRP